MKTREDFDTTEEYVAYLEATNAAMKAQAAAGNALRLKISEKGALSVYGMGRFPVTLYKEQWIRLFAQSKTIVEFIREHDEEFATKPVKAAA